NSTSCPFDSGCGTMFKIAKTASGYANIPTTLVSFDGRDGFIPYAGLIIDPNGNLFGTTYLGGAGYVGPTSPGLGTVFEVVKTANGYANVPTTLTSFYGSTNGRILYGNLVADSNGNLFGTTYSGGTFNYGTVFQIVNNGTSTAPSYANTPTTLVSFNGS